MSQPTRPMAYYNPAYYPDGPPQRQRAGAALRYAWTVGVLIWFIDLILIITQSHGNKADPDVVALVVLFLLGLIFVIISIGAKIGEINREQNGAVGMAAKEVFKVAGTVYLGYRVALPIVRHIHQEINEP